MSYIRDDESIEEISEINYLPKLREINPRALTLVQEYQSLLPNAPVDIFALGTALGMKITPNKNLPFNHAGGIMLRDLATDVPWQERLIIKKPAEYVINYNVDHPRTRQRFTVAHFIAHCLLHSDHLVPGENYIENVLMRGRRMGLRQEEEANCLALQILIPAATINNYTERRHGALWIRELAEISHTSEAATAIRLGIPMDI